MMEPPDAATKIKIPSDFQNTVRVLGRRATFVAGYAYYQVQLIRLHFLL